jgi:translation initiation factor 3 subunit L
LEVYTTGGNPDTVAGDFGRQPLYKMMGYFSLVGLLRLHSLLGDFHQAIKVQLGILIDLVFYFLQPIL